MLADVLIVIITALFLAASPSLYTQGLARLFPVRRRIRVLKVLDMCYRTLRQWLMGMLLAAPFLAVLLMLVRELYVHDVLEREQAEKLTTLP